MSEKTTYNQLTLSLEVSPARDCRWLDAALDWLTSDQDCGGMKDTPRYRMLGNAVAVPVARWIGERIVAQETAR